MSRQVGVGRSRFQPFAAPVIAEPLQDCVAPKAHFTVSLGQRPRNQISTNCAMLTIYCCLKFVHNPSSHHAMIHLYNAAAAEVAARNRHRAAGCIRSARGDPGGQWLRRRRPQRRASSQRKTTFARRTRGISGISCSVRCPQQRMREMLPCSIAMR